MAGAILGVAARAASAHAGPAMATYRIAIAPIAGQVQSTPASVRAARQTARQTGDWTAYHAAVKQARVTLRGLRAQVRAAQEA